MRVAVISLNTLPADGCYIRGLFVEGARWDMAENRLAESRPKELYTDMPVIWLKPVANRKQLDSGIYECPVYKTLTRAGQYLNNCNKSICKCRPRIILFSIYILNLEKVKS